LNTVPNLASGSFIVVCDTCGYKSPRGDLIEFAGEELIQHMQVVGCSANTFLEEVNEFTQLSSQTVEVKSNEQELVKQVGTTQNTVESKENIVDQLTKLASLKEKGAISNEEVLFIKKEIIKKLK
jgi:hypothetical protein